MDVLGAIVLVVDGSRVGGGGGGGKGGASM